MPQLLDASTSILADREIQSSEFYESAVLIDETIISNYWYLGLSYLLEGREEDAQAAWFVPLSGVNEADVDIYTDELSMVLEQQANTLAQVSDLEAAWLIRQHLWILKPDRVENILQLVILADQLDLLTSESLINWQIDELLKMQSVGNIDDRLLELTMAALLNRIYTDLSLNIVESCLKLAGDSRHSISLKLVNRAFELFHQKKLGIFATKLVETSHNLFPDELGICQVLAGLYSGIDLHTQAIAVSEYYYQSAQNTLDRLFGSYLIQRSYLTAGNWQGYQERLDLHRSLQRQIINNLPSNLPEFQYQHSIISSFFYPYIEDNPRTNRSLQNQISRIHQNSLSDLRIKSDVEELVLEKKIGVIRIGYLASTLKEHSVGWLSRWLFHYHDRQSFQIFNYCINQNSQDPFNHKWFRDKVDISYYFENNPERIAAQIEEDKIDILIDLDSLTFDLSCKVMAYKPAPLQVTWLGWDASGLPAIDYFIADPYVLPDDAQDYYQEKIWRLPQTYLAVDGFEVGIPTLNRQDLGIPDDAIVYFSSQGGYKRHPDNIRCQMRIIKAVPNSYLLIKGKSDPEMIRDLFGKIGEEEGVSLEQLRFLSGVPDEYTHRANLAIADIVLDTFPYNGATTTLETLWMGIPMVTQVGQQFAARNSYTFMLNAGIEEGIAWNQQEYIDWGIKLGLDRDLRDKIAGKLRSGRTTAPVWNAKQFTLDMEQAYREMWEKYQAQRLDDEVIELHSQN